MISGRRRPQRSLSGPQTSCPAASPIRHVVSESCTCASGTPRSAARAGNAGRYMSSDSGPIAVIEPEHDHEQRVRGRAERAAASGAVGCEDTTGR